jgi:hypothetical protein
MLGDAQLAGKEPAHVGGGFWHPGMAQVHRCTQTSDGPQVTAPHVTGCAPPSGAAQAPV